EWLRAQSNPEAFVRGHLRASGGEATRAQLTYAIERIAYSDPVLALELWTPLVKTHGFSSVRQYRTSRHIALWMARDRRAGAYALLAGLPQAAQNDEVLRWRARCSLRDHNWRNLLTDIALMSQDERNSEEWRYWRAVALHGSGQLPEAQALFAELAEERSYYGFLAADELDASYPLDGGEIVVNEAIISELSNRPELVRARELFLVGLDGRGRSEWDAVVRYLPREKKIQAAKLAHRWGWHSQAISSAAGASEFDDLALRYPLPYAQTFRQHAETASISTTWAYGVARSESLFMRDVRSSAGAIGLMQLMPATGRKVARDLQLPYSGLDTLTDPQINIRLGTTYLGQMAERFGGNRVLATAAYNAGPHRVDRWLPDSGSIDARIWIENIPFNETRNYVRRVLAADVIFQWRMTGQVRRLSDELLTVKADTDTQKLAENRF
ncbi:MAG: transglycosylase SLT domain-containing protein, partial [Gammaproteobacteria bacterium]|nr:transglycosylase SLT domain-containing protein [Gammaproteobacteria bacterium]